MMVGRTSGNERGFVRRHLNDKHDDKHDGKGGDHAHQ
jgi:hypothetical protein